MATDVPIHSGPTPVPSVPATSARVSAPVEETRARLPLGTALRFSVASVGSNLVFALFNFVLPQYLASYRLPPALIGLLANERSFVGGLIQPFVGRLSDRTRTRLGRRRPFFLAGVPLMALALLVLGLHPPLALTLPLVAIAAFFLFVAVDPYFAMMADLTPPAQRGQVGALLGAAAMLGTILLSLVAALLWSRHEFLVFAIAAGGLVICFGFTFLTVREPPLPTLSVATMARTGAVSTGPASLPRYARDVLRYRELSKYIGAQALYNLGTGGAVPFLTLFATRALGVSASAAFLLTIVMVLSTALGTVPAGLLADCLGKKPLLSAGLGLLATGCLLGSQVPSVAWAIPAMVLVGLGNACPTALSISLLADLAPAERMGEFVGPGSCVWSIAQPLGSVCAGLLVSSAVPATYRHTFIWAGVLIAGAALVMLTVRPPRVHRQ